MRYPVTPDGRYFVVRGRLWRMSNPNFSEAERKKLTKELMSARRDVGAELKKGDEKRIKAARDRVNAAKFALGERGSVWWNDDGPDYNRQMVQDTPYKEWFEGPGIKMPRQGGGCRGSGCSGPGSPS
jgi:hypothetical protein